MKIDLSDIISKENWEVAKQAFVELPTISSRMGEFPVVEKSPFRLFFSNVEKKRLKVEGNTEISIQIPCDRCLKGVVVSFPIKINKEFLIADLLEHSKSESKDEDLHYITGMKLDVDQLIFGEVLIAWPMKVLCKEDCRGICNKCGNDLNFTECSCPKTEPDVRMAAIQDIFNNYKEV